ncbi:nuclear transport factor 2 family protein [Glycomyces rhizosphaerae]|uniref:Nuclear transport factor 2 family protein n=1 Tax=Glycomyces rhizosphaerae TaxID=2054422 RepID=A0ABV7PTB8_9ACTN
MTDFNAIAADYINAFNETDAAERKRLVAELFTADVYYVDPMAAVSGHDGVDAFIAAAHQQFPGWVFTLVGPVDGHGTQARFTWGLGPAGAEPPVIGFDVIVVDEDGRIVQVLGFLDKVPTA